jgi:hypothetical protein
MWDPVQEDKFSVLLILKAASTKDMQYKKYKESNKEIRAAQSLKIFKVVDLQMNSSIH